METTNPYENTVEKRNRKELSHRYGLPMMIDGDTAQKKEYCERLIRDAPDRYSWKEMELPKSGKYRYIRSQLAHTSQVAHTINAFPVVYTLGNGLYKVLVKSRERKSNPLPEVDAPCTCPDDYGTICTCKCWECRTMHLQGELQH